MRAVAQRLNCSTQPVLYCFSTVDELKQAVYARADEDRLFSGVMNTLGEEK